MHHAIQPGPESVNQDTMSSIPPCAPLGIPGAPSVTQDTVLSVPASSSAPVAPSKRPQRQSVKPSWMKDYIN